MAKHGTVRMMTVGQLKDIAATMIGAIPELTFAEATRIIGAKGRLNADVANIIAFLKNAREVTPLDCSDVDEETVMRSLYP
jgi:hypothetical protein